MVLFDVPPLPEDPRTRRDTSSTCTSGPPDVGKVLDEPCLLPAWRARRIWGSVACFCGRLMREAVVLTSGFNPNDEWLELVLPGLEWG